MVPFLCYICDLSGLILIFGFGYWTCVVSRTNLLSLLILMLKTRDWSQRQLQVYAWKKFCLVVLILRGDIELY